MAIDWDKLQVKVIDDDHIPITDDYKYTMSSEQRMVIFAGRRGEQGPAGPAGPVGPAGPAGGASWGNIDGDIENQTDLADALALKANTADLGDLATQDTVDYQTEVTNKPTLGTMASVDDAPSDSKEYVRKNGAWTESSGGGGGIASVSWGDINGTLANQTDLQTALASKADEADLGEMSYEDDAPSDNAEYVRKNGAWAVSSGGISSVAWGDIEGTLSDQTDLQTALDTKAPAIFDLVPEKRSGTYVVVPIGVGLVDFKATYHVTQTGTGTPSASNIRPFESTEWCVVVMSDGYDGYSEMSTRNIQLQSSIYCGVVDVLNGVVSITHGHIASYNGETLTGRWYSDRDEYAAGTTPTTGAEVVYELETPIEQTCQSYTPLLFPSKDTYLRVSHQNSYRPIISNYYTVEATFDTYEQDIVDTKTYIDQNDALKANVSDLGDLAYEDDAPSDNAEYVRKNGAWAVSSGGGGTTAPTWGAITGTLSQQTDLQNALNAKTNTADLGALASKDTVNYATEVTNKPTFGSLASKDSVNYETEVTNKPALGTMSAVNDAPSDSKEYVRKNGVWAEKSSDPVSWGDVSGTLANQTDLATALNSKADVTDLADESKLAHHTYYVKGTQTGTTGNWTGNLPEVEALYEGLSIDYYLPYAGSGNATLNLTLKDGVQTGAVPCYIGSTSRLTTHIPQYYVCHLTYQTVTINNVEYTGWYLSRSIDTNDIANNVKLIERLFADSNIYRYQLLFHTDADTVTPLNNVNNTTGTSKAMLTNVDFNPFDEIIYWYSSGTWNSGAIATSNSAFYHQHASIDLRYSINCGATLTADELVYLKVIPQSNGMVRLAPDPCWAQSLPATNDGYWYILLGRIRENSTYLLSLFPDHPIYYHDGTRIMQAQPQNLALTGAPTAPTPASGDDSTRIATTEWVTDAVSGKADTADLGDLATLDSIDYTSNKLTNKPTLGAMASQSDAPSDSKEYVRKNGAWAESSGGGGGISSVAWGDVTGTLANQTDLANALNGKQNVLTFDSAPTASSTNPVESGGVKTALDAKQDTLTFDTTPTANSTNPVTSGGVKSYVDSHDDFKITGTVSSSGYTLTDSRINDEHWEVDWVQFGTSSNVITGGSWTTDIVNHTLTLSATYSGSTSVVVNMHWVQ